MLLFHNQPLHGWLRLHKLHIINYSHLSLCTFLTSIILLSPLPLWWHSKSNNFNKWLKLEVSTCNIFSHMLLVKILLFPMALPCECVWFISLHTVCCVWLFNRKLCRVFAVFSGAQNSWIHSINCLTHLVPRYFLILTDRGNIITFFYYFCFPQTQPSVNSFSEALKAQLDIKSPIEVAGRHNRVRSLAQVTVYCITDVLSCCELKCVFYLNSLVCSEKHVGQ